MSKPRENISNKLQSVHHVESREGLGKYTLYY